MPISRDIKPTVAKAAFILAEGRFRRVAVQTKALEGLTDNICDTLYLTGPEHADWPWISP